MAHGATTAVLGFEQPAHPFDGRGALTLDPALEGFGPHPCAPNSGLGSLLEIDLTDGPDGVLRDPGLSHLGQDVLDQVEHGRWERWSDFAHPGREKGSHPLGWFPCDSLCQVVLGSIDLGLSQSSGLH